MLSPTREITSGRNTSRTSSHPRLDRERRPTRRSRMRREKPSGRKERRARRRGSLKLKEGKVRDNLQAFCSSFRMMRY
jgi:hypothetical protein